MRILIIEDEHYAAKRLVSMLEKVIPQAEILAILDSVEESKNWFQSHVEPDLIFMDIQLADGLSFKIFEEVKFKCPVIFITAFDEYAIDAFKLNSVDYLLKPIESDKLLSAVEKFKKLHFKQSLENVNWSELAISLYSKKEEYKKRFLIKVGNAFQYLESQNIAFVYSEDGVSFAINKNGDRLILDNTIESISDTLDPNDFFKISRKHIIAVSEISKIHPYLNSRLKIELKQPITQELIVSREKVKEFKSWLDR